MNISLNKDFVVPTTTTYPPHNYMVFEEYFYNCFQVEETQKFNRKYLPVLWTNYYISKNYGSQDMSDLQSFLDGLDRETKYFTIVQWDDGIINNIEGLDILSFASGGVGTYPIPLICMPSPQNIVPTTAKKRLASFVGEIKGRHSVRERMYNTLNQWAYISESTTYKHFIEEMRSSVFALCPRGYGKTSFRICEALQQGAIPIYIYDDPWIPYNDLEGFQKIGIAIHIDKIDSLPSMINQLSASEVIALQNEGRKSYQKLYSYHGCFKKNISILNNEEIK